MARLSRARWGILIMWNWQAKICDVGRVGIGRGLEGARQQGAGGGGGGDWGADQGALCLPPRWLDTSKVWHFDRENLLVLISCRDDLFLLKFLRATSFNQVHSSSPPWLFHHCFQIVSNKVFRRPGSSSPSSRSSSTSYQAASLSMLSKYLRVRVERPQYFATSHPDLARFLVSKCFERNF